MSYPNDWRYAQDRYNDMLREAERMRQRNAWQPKRPSLVTYLKAQLATLSDLARPQRNRAQRA